MPIYEICAYKVRRGRNISVAQRACMSVGACAFSILSVVTRVGCRVVLSIMERNVQQYKGKYIILKYYNFL